MHVKVFLLFVLAVIGLCICLLPAGTDGLPQYSRNAMKKCSPTCSIYCQCGYMLDSSDCPTCRCRPSNICTGRHPNHHPRHRPAHGKSQIIY